jgi:Ca-activated chloride channel family protein
MAFLLLAALVLTGCGKASGGSKTAAPAADKPSATTSAPAPAQQTPPAPQPQKATAAPSDMYYQDYGDNPQVSASTQPVSTFAVDVDTASYTLTRSYLSRGTLPPREAIRAEEFINYFPQNYPEPEQTVGTYVLGAQSPFRPSRYLVQVGLKAKSEGWFTRKPARLTFVVDTSGSMETEDRMGLVKQSLTMLLDHLQADDQVAIVSYSNTAKLEQAHTADKELLRAAIERLRPDASTNAEAGLKLGYEQAARVFRQDAINRVILCSDGVANVGDTSPDGMLRAVSDYKARGITLTTVGVGMGNYNDVLLEQLADKGDGQYSYVDTPAEAKRIFVSQLTGTLENVAKDVKVQVHFYPEQVVSYRLVGYENRVMRNDQFRNDYADGGEMGAGQTVTALYEIQVQGSGPDLGYVSVRYKDASSKEVIEQSTPIHRRAVTSPAAPEYSRVRWSAAVAEFAGVLGGNPWAIESRLADVAAVARNAAAALDNPQPHREAIDLMEQAMQLRR